MVAIMESTGAISLDSVVTMSSGLVTGDMGGEKAMLNIEKGKYYALDTIASRIWELMETPRTVRDMARVLLEEYDVEEKECQSELLSFLSKLCDAGLVKIA
jgi:hypothetical protein